MAQTSVKSVAATERLQEEAVNPKEFDQRWNALAEDVMTGMADWRVQHPPATFRQIEAALDERLPRS